MNDFIYFKLTNAELDINAYLQVSKSDYVHARKLLEATVYVDEVHKIRPNTISRELLKMMVKKHKSHMILISDGSNFDYYNVINTS